MEVTFELDFGNHGYWEKDFHTDEFYPAGLVFLIPGVCFAKVVSHQRMLREDGPGWCRVFLRVESFSRGITPEDVLDALGWKKLEERPGSAKYSLVPVFDRIRQEKS